MVCLGKPRLKSKPGVISHMHYGDKLPRIDKKNTSSRKDSYSYDKIEKNLEELLDTYSSSGSEDESQNIEGKKMSEQPPQQHPYRAAASAGNNNQQQLLAIEGY